MLLVRPFRSPLFEAIGLKETCWLAAAAFFARIWDLWSSQDLIEIEIYAELHLANTDLAACR